MDERNEALQVREAVARNEAVGNCTSQQEGFQRRWNELEITPDTDHLGGCYFFSILVKG